MKKIIFLFFTIAFNLNSGITFSDTISIQDAVNKNLISCTVNSMGNYRGQCIVFSIVNKTAEDILLRLEAGRFMMPADTTRQRMIITKERYIAINKNASDTAKSYAMCSQMHKKAPSANTIFSIGKMAEEKLLKLVNIIDTNNYQTMAAQFAIWAITDNNDITDIHSADMKEMIALRQYVLNVKDYYNNVKDYVGFFKVKTDISDSTYLKYSFDKVEGAIQFELKEDAQLSLVLYNVKGEIVKSCFRNKEYKAGTNTITYDFSYYTVPKGDYYLKLYDKKSNILVNKFMTFKTSVYSF